MNNRITDYYAKKLQEYNSKYAVGPFTHIHTGYFPKSGSPYCIAI